MCWHSCRMEDQGRPSSVRRVLAAAKSSSSPLREKLDFQFRFGVPLEQLPCLYLGDCGYVPAFLVDAGKMIKSNIDCEGLFRKSGDLRRQNILKSQVEKGGSLSECDVHDVTSLVKFFFRLLPEPLVPYLFHDPLLACLNITHHDRRVEAVQGLCFSLPAHNLSSLRYFMRLLASIASQWLVNRMTARNLAVVLTPSLIRMKSRSKLMTEEELRALPHQTALVEHLICHAASIGVMTSRMFHGSLRLLEDKSNKLKAKTWKKNGTQRKILEKQLELEKRLLFFIADLGFRPNSCHSVPDTQVISEPNARISFVLRKKHRLPRSCTRSCGQSPCRTRKSKKHVMRQKTILFHDVPLSRVCAVDQRAKSTITDFRKNTIDEDLFPFGWAIGPSLLESWSKAIPVIEVNTQNDDETSTWSDLSEDISAKVPSRLCQKRSFIELPGSHQGCGSGSPRSLISPCKLDAHDQCGAHSAKPAIGTTSARINNVMEKVNVSTALYPESKETLKNCIAGEKNKAETSPHAAKQLTACEESTHTTKDRLIKENKAENKRLQKESGEQKPSPESLVLYPKADNSKGARGKCDKVESKPPAAAARGSQGATTSPKDVLGCRDVHKKRESIQAKVSCSPLTSSVVQYDSSKQSTEMPLPKSSPRTENPTPCRECVKGGSSPGVGKVCTADPARPLNDSSQQRADVGIPDKNTIVSLLPEHKNNDTRPETPMSDISSPEACLNKLDELWVKERSSQRLPFLLTNYTKLYHQGHPRVSSTSCKGQQMDSALNGQPICDKNHVSGDGNINRRLDVVPPDLLLGQAEKSSKLSCNILKHNVQECKGKSRKEHPAGFLAHPASDRSVDIRKITSTVEVEKRRQRQKLEVARQSTSPRSQKKAAEPPRRSTIAEFSPRSHSQLGSFSPECNSDNKEARGVTPRLGLGAPGQLCLLAFLKVPKCEAQINGADALDKSCHQSVTSHGTSATQSAIRECRPTNAAEHEKSDRPLKRHPNKATSPLHRHYSHQQNPGTVRGEGVQSVDLVQIRIQASSTAAVSAISHVSRSVRNKCKAENVGKIKSSKPSRQSVQSSSPAAANHPCESPNLTSDSTQRHAVRTKGVVPSPHSPAGGETESQMTRFDNSSTPRGTDILSGRMPRSRLQLSNSMQCLASPNTGHSTAAFVQLDPSGHRARIQRAEQSTGYNHEAVASPLENIDDAISLLEEKNLNRSARNNSAPSRFHPSNLDFVSQKAQGEEVKVATFIVSSGSLERGRGGNEKRGSDNDQDEDSDYLGIIQRNLQALKISGSEEELRCTAMGCGDKSVKSGYHVTRNRISHPSQSVPRRHDVLLSRTFESLEQELLLGSCAKSECGDHCSTENMTVCCGQQTNSAEDTSDRSKSGHSILQERAVESHEAASPARPDNHSTVVLEAHSGTREAEQDGYVPPLGIPVVLQNSSQILQSRCSANQRSEKITSPGRPSGEKVGFQEGEMSVCLFRTDPRRCEIDSEVVNTFRHKSTSDLNSNRNYSECLRNVKSVAVARRSAVFEPDGDIKLKYNN